MRIIFAGTPEVALPGLEALLASEHEVVGVLTRDDAPVGRKHILTASPVAQFAHERGLHVIKANRITSDVESAIRDLNPDLGVVIAYGCILPQSTLDLISHGWINLHFSALPALRGAAPAQHDLLNGAEQGSLSVFQIVLELDAGDVLVQESIDYRGDETAGQALALLADRGATVLVEVVNSIDAGTAEAQSQQGEVTVARKFVRDDGHLDPSHGDLSTFNRFRAMTPEPGAWFMMGGQVIKVLQASMPTSNPGLTVSELREVDGHILLGCLNGAIELLEVLPAGKQAMKAPDWFRGVRSSGPVYVS